jgi:hypothetical protein
MRFFISLMFVAIATTTMAAERGRKPHAETPNASNVKFLRELERQVERSGFRKATVMPKVFLVRVEDDDGKPVMLLVNSDTLQAMILEGAADALTGSVTAKELDIPKLH